MVIILLITDPRDYNNLKPMFTSNTKRKIILSQFTLIIIHSVRWRDLTLLQQGLRVSNSHTSNQAIEKNPYQEKTVEECLLQMTHGNIYCFVIFYWSVSTEFYQQFHSILFRLPFCKIRACQKCSKGCQKCSKGLFPSNLQMEILVELANSNLNWNL